MERVEDVMGGAQPYNFADDCVVGFSQTCAWACWLACVPTRAVLATVASQQQQQQQQHCGYAPTPTQLPRSATTLHQHSGRRINTPVRTRQQGIPRAAVDPYTDSTAFETVRLDEERARVTDDEDGSSQAHHEDDDGDAGVAVPSQHEMYAVVHADDGEVERDCVDSYECPALDGATSSDDSAAYPATAGVGSRERYDDDDEDDFIVGNDDDDDDGVEEKMKMSAARILAYNVAASVRKNYKSASSRHKMLLKTPAHRNRKKNAHSNEKESLVSRNDDDDSDNDGDEKSKLDPVTRAQRIVRWWEGMNDELEQVKRHVEQLNPHSTADVNIVQYLRRCERECGLHSGIMQYQHAKTDELPPVPVAFPSSPNGYY